MGKTSNDTAEQPLLSVLRKKHGFEVAVLIFAACFYVFVMIPGPPSRYKIGMLMIIVVGSVVGAVRIVLTILKRS